MTEMTEKELIEYIRNFPKTPLAKESEYAEFLTTEEELEMFLSMTAEQQQDYLDAQASYQNMKAYLANHDNPPEARAFLSLDGWAEHHEEKETSQ